jgi:hypothetical protein
MTVRGNFFGILVGATVRNKQEEQDENNEKYNSPTGIRTEATVHGGSSFHVVSSLVNEAESE